MKKKRSDTHLAKAEVITTIYDEETGELLAEVIQLTDQQIRQLAKDDKTPSYEDLRDDPEYIKTCFDEDLKSQAEFQDLR